MQIDNTKLLEALKHLGRPDAEKAAIEKAEVVDGEAILTIPATAEQGFVILKSKDAAPSDFKEPPTTIDVRH